MKYFKIVLDKEFIGAINSYDFLVEIKNKLRAASESTGQFVEIDGVLYRDSWMAPTPNCQHEFLNASVSEITEQEYNAYIRAKQNHETIIIDDEDTPEPAQKPTPDSIEDPDELLEYVRSSKIAEMSRACNKTIESGFDIETEDGIHHYSYALEDQLNLMNLSAAIARGEEQLFYHADGELCKFYTAAEINEIISAGNAWKTYHTTYFNALKAYINSLETIEEIDAITYDMELPEEFKSDVLRVIE